ncbi:MAG TPA: DUF433 domain-containing protein [Pyrinomonadaceae bacterium]|nr:DUF433 domain-containing protein [Pyrinomonadaceae bacterium]
MKLNSHLYSLVFVVCLLLFTSACIAGGRPCIRGMRIRVIDVLDLFAAGLSSEQILDEMPDLELEDLQAALQLRAEIPQTRV